MRHVDFSFAGILALGGGVGEIVDAVMGHAEAVPWGKRWAAQVPHVLGPCIAEDWLEALNELRGRVEDDLDQVVCRLGWRLAKERMAR